MFGLHILFDVEFNAVSEYVHGFEVYLIIKGLLGQKSCLWDIFFGFYVFLDEPSRQW